MLYALYDSKLIRLVPCTSCSSSSLSVRRPRLRSMQVRCSISSSETSQNVYPTVPLPLRTACDENKSRNEPTKLAVAYASVFKTSRVTIACVQTTKSRDIGLRASRPLCVRHRPVLRCEDPCRYYTKQYKGQTAAASSQESRVKSQDTDLQIYTTSTAGPSATMPPSGCVGVCVGRLPSFPSPAARCDSSMVYAGSLSVLQRRLWILVRQCVVSA